MNSIWKVDFDPRARADFAKLDKPVQQRIVKFLGRLTVDPRQHGAALQGETLGNYWKYRVGDYRLIADIQDGKLTVLVVAIGHRSRIYR
ncbi:mRNA interferase RelE/StbE [Methylomagnum ishizawai]|uniref:mRNA interferase RelE/StbE n=1 Tax=Methylomagnum ishizawai TaxID=1760988 RepID=A0A1Y6D0S4_9GAMM|nr:type II toxin-antitoxin system RelE/ParE family toxin [Methylomagnum ishizawai]SMF96528.1 mRNA interferase RelE/StbE [Methylomagnum ishizawai]